MDRIDVSDSHTDSKRKVFYFTDVEEDTIEVLVDKDERFLHITSDISTDDIRVLVGDVDKLIRALSMARDFHSL